MPRRKNDETTTEIDPLDQVTFVAPTETPKSTPRPEGPYYMDEGWQEFLMSLFKPEELRNGLPKLNGLKRVTETLLGDVVFSAPIQVFPSSNEIEGGRACVVYQVHIDWRICKRGDQYYPQPLTLQRRIFGGTASCFIGNCGEDKFSVFPESVAESRAAARAYRNALGLACIAAEEVEAGDYTPKGDAITWSEEGKINTPQEIVIKSKVSSLKLNLDSILGGRKLNELKSGEAGNLIQQLDSYVANPSTIPQEFLGESK